MAAMKTRVRKWGNCLAVCIPKSLAEEAGITQDSLVEITLWNGGIAIAPIAQPEYTLEKLVCGISRRNRHPEFDTGAPVGNEIR
jgi:antitoxin MazE